MDIVKKEEFLNKDIIKLLNENKCLLDFLVSNKNILQELVEERKPKHNYSCQPKTKNELQQIILERFRKAPISVYKIYNHSFPLNDIDVSLIEDMSCLFNTGQYSIFRNFNWDISEWDMTNVKSISSMFFGCTNFNCDLSRWRLPRLEKMICAFHGCKNFQCDLSGWNSNSVKMDFAFCECPSTPKWYDRERMEANIHYKPCW